MRGALSGDRLVFQDFGWQEGCRHVSTSLVVMLRCSQLVCGLGFVLARVRICWGEDVVAGPDYGGLSAGSEEDCVVSVEGV